jgi:hypothetical protein
MITDYGKFEYCEASTYLIRRLTPQEDKRACIKEFLLKKIKEAHDKGDDAGIGRLLREAMVPQVVDDRTFRLAGYNFDVIGTIYSGSKSDQVLGGWKLLVEESVPIDIYLEAFYISSLDTSLNHLIENDTKVDHETYISMTMEPVVLELLRLCYWIYKCKEILDQKSFAAKFNEVKSNLTFNDLDEFKNRLHRNFRLLAKLMADKSIPRWERAFYERELMELVEVGGPFRSNVSSYVPEFMSAALMKEAGFEIDFISTANEKRCDLLMNSFKMEIKTFFDTSNEAIKLEKSLGAEILETLERDKAVKDIKNALSKKPNMVLFFLSFTSLGAGFTKHTYKKNVDFSLQSALSESISVAQHNRTSQNREKISVVTFTTAIDFHDCIYRMFFYTVPYPVKKNNNDEFEPVPEKLTIDLTF